jgi:shikimate kinase/3-dehydroquinate synthase
VLADTVLPAAEPDVFARAMSSVLALHELPSGTRMAWARSATGEYPAFVGRGLLEHGFWPLQGRRFLVADATVAEHYGDMVGPVAGAIQVRAGERSKTMGEAERVLRELASQGMNRDDHVVALGGGVVGDLAGFCAAVYQRGVGVVQVPTSLVAQVDSAYGGKTGVDLPEAKNYVGAYHLPAAVLADPGTLATLPREELAAGFVEVIKTALIAGGSLWEQVRAVQKLDPEALDEIVFACARTKIAVVASDERDSGRRAMLNLGHTVGHAIEAVSGYGRYRHGEAVGLGLLASLRLSEADELRGEVEELLAHHGLPTRLDQDLPVTELLAVLERDKKRTSRGVGFVLVERPGEVLTGQTVAADRVRTAVEELMPAGTG